MAYQHYVHAKELISIPAIAARNNDPTEIFGSEKFKTIERIVTSEELSIVMFLTNIAKQLKKTQIVENSRLIKEEIEDIFHIKTSSQHLSWLFGAHI